MKLQTGIPSQIFELFSNNFTTKNPYQNQNLVHSSVISVLFTNSFSFSLNFLRYQRPSLLMTPKTSLHLLIKRDFLRILPQMRAFFMKLYGKCWPLVSKGLLLFIISSFQATTRAKMQQGQESSKQSLFLAAAKVNSSFSQFSFTLKEFSAAFEKITLSLLTSQYEHSIVPIVKVFSLNFRLWSIHTSTPFLDATAMSSASTLSVVLPGPTCTLLTFLRLSDRSDSALELAFPLKYSIFLMMGRPLALSLVLLFSITISSSESDEEFPNSCFLFFNISSLRFCFCTRQASCSFFRQFQSSVSAPSEGFVDPSSVSIQIILESTTSANFCCFFSVFAGGQIIAITYIYRTTTHQNTTIAGQGSAFDDLVEDLEGVHELVSCVGEAVEAQLGDGVFEGPIGLNLHLYLVEGDEVGGLGKRLEHRLLDLLLDLLDLLLLLENRRRRWQLRARSD